MLAYSRRSSPELELTDLHELIDEAASVTGRHSDRKRVGVIFDLADDMPPVPIDINGVHQALVNVLMNAIDAAPPRKGVVTVSTNFDASSHRVTIKVADNGSGMDESEIARVFEAFHSNKGQRGTGLGLTVTSYQRTREMTIDELLLENRIVFLIGEINHVSAAG
jgi:two-component system NtrC family sensor kinase